MATKNLSEPTTFKLRKLELLVYPVSLETLVVISPKLKELDKMGEDADFVEQVDKFCDVIFEITKEDNSDLTIEKLKKNLTIPACLDIIQTATGSNSVGI